MFPNERPPVMNAITTRPLLLVEDDPTQAQWMQEAIALLDPNWQVLRCGTGSQALERIEKPGETYDLAIVDMGLPDLGGLEVVRAWRRRFANAPLLVVSAISAERAVLEAIRGGASGYVVKDGDPLGLAQAIRQVLNGDSPISPSLARYLFKLAGSPQASGNGPSILLTHKERETLQHIGRGHSYAETAQLMGVSVSTVQTHVRSLYRKLGAHSQMQAVVKARENGLI